MKDTATLEELLESFGIPEILTAVANVIGGEAVESEVAEENARRRRRVLSKLNAKLHAAAETMERIEDACRAAIAIDDDNDDDGEELMTLGETPPE